MTWSRRWLIDSQDRWFQVLSALRTFELDFKRKPVEIIVRVARQEKSQEQRALFHALLTEFGNALGYRLPEIKDIVKRAYYGVEVKTLPSGKTYEVVKSSEEEDRAGYSALIDFTLQFASENGVFLHTRETR